jgi:hypothetical protein
MSAGEAKFIAKLRAGKPAWVFGFLEEDEWNLDFTELWAPGHPHEDSARRQCVMQTDDEGTTHLMQSHECNTLALPVCKRCPTIAHHHVAHEDVLQAPLEGRHRRHGAVTSTTSTPALLTTTDQRLTTTTTFGFEVTTTTTPGFVTDDDDGSGSGGESLSGGATLFAPTSTTAVPMTTTSTAQPQSNSNRRIRRVNNMMNAEMPKPSDPHHSHLQIDDHLAIAAGTICVENTKHDV